MTDSDLIDALNDPDVLDRLDFTSATGEWGVRYATGEWGTGLAARDAIYLAASVVRHARKAVSEATEVAK